MVKLVASIMIHVLAGRHPTRMCPVEGNDQLSELSREKRVAPIKFPAVGAPVQYLVLQTMPPFHCFGIVVVNDPALALPPFHLIAPPREIPPGPRKFVEIV